MKQIFDTNANKDLMNKTILAHSMKWVEDSETKSQPWMEIN